MNFKNSGTNMTDESSSNDVDVEESSTFFELQLRGL